MRLGAWWLNDERIQTVEDWGSGHGGFRSVLNERQTYIGLDGSSSKYADKRVDFEDYVSDVDGAHMRHVIEHNYEWEKVLRNFLSSFQIKGVLTLFTPFSDETFVEKEFDWHGSMMPNICFSKSDLDSVFTEMGVEWSLMQGLDTPTEYGIEHIYFLAKPEENEENV